MDVDFPSAAYSQTVTAKAALDEAPSREVEEDDLYHRPSISCKPLFWGDGRPLPFPRTFPLPQPSRRCEARARDGSRLSAWHRENGMNGSAWSLIPQGPAVSMLLAPGMSGQPSGEAIAETKSGQRCAHCDPRPLVRAKPGRSDAVRLRHRDDNPTRAHRGSSLKCCRRHHGDNVMMAPPEVPAF